MVLPPSGTQTSLEYSKQLIQSTAQDIKNRANIAITTMAAGPVSTAFVYDVLDSLIRVMAALNFVKNTTGLDAYAQAQIPGYSTSMLTDANATIAAAQACIDWVFNNFPKDGTNTWLLAEQLNADGTRTLRNFTSAQTSGFRTVLTNLVNTIG